RSRFFLRAAYAGSGDPTSGILAAMICHDYRGPNGTQIRKGNARNDHRYPVDEEQMHRRPQRTRRPIRNWVSVTTPLCLRNGARETRERDERCGLEGPCKAEMIRRPFAVS